MCIFRTTPSRLSYSGVCDDEGIRRVVNDEKAATLIRHWKCAFEFVIWDCGRPAGGVITWPDFRSKVARSCVMRVWHLLLSLLFLFLVSPAQQLPSSQGTPLDTSTGGSDPKTFVGCVTAMNGAFRLVTESGAVLRLKGHHSELFGYNG